MPAKNRKQLDINLPIDYNTSTSSIILLTQMILQQYARERLLFPDHCFVKKLFKPNRTDPESPYVAVYTLKTGVSAECDLFIDWFTKDVPKLIKFKCLNGLSLDLFSHQELETKESGDSGNCTTQPLFESLVLKIAYDDTNNVNYNNKSERENEIAITPTILRTKQSMLLLMRKLESRTKLLDILPTDCNASMRLIIDEDLIRKIQINNFKECNINHTMKVYQDSFFETFQFLGLVNTNLHNLKMYLFSELDGFQEKRTNLKYTELDLLTDNDVIVNRDGDKTNLNLKNFLDKDITVVNHETQVVSGAFNEELSRKRKSEFLIEEDEDLESNLSEDNDTALKSGNAEEDQEVERGHEYAHFNDENSCCSSSDVKNASSLLAGKLYCFTKNIDKELKKANTTPFQETLAIKSDIFAENTLPTLPKKKRKLMISMKTLNGFHSDSSEYFKTLKENTAQSHLIKKHTSDGKS